MKAEELIAFINVSRNVIIEKQQTLLDDIKKCLKECMDMFKLTQEQRDAITEYVNQYFYIDAIFLYNRIKELAENQTVYKTIWVAEDDEYIVEPTEFPVAYFQSVIYKLNNN